MREFLAIGIPDPVRDALRSLRDGLRERCAGWRWVDPANLHLTIRFLGEVEEATDRRVRRAWRRAADASERFRLRLDGLGSFPERGRPRVLWVEMCELDGTRRLARLAEGLEAAARANGFAPDGKRFQPHLTLARAVRTGRVTLPGAFRVPEAPPIEVRELMLFASELNPAGARYTALARFPLGREEDGQE